jgi:cytochrome d ubiquinol oxidase subunit II
MLAGLFNTPFYPTLQGDLTSSLTIENASSSKYTLIVMSYVSLMIPFILAYIVWAWSVIASKPMTKKTMKNEFETY